MELWWASLTWLERLFAYVAFPATLLLILQTLLLLFGLGHDGDGDADGADIGMDGDVDADFDPDVEPDAGIGADFDAAAGLDPAADMDTGGDFIPCGDHDAPEATAQDGPFAGLKLFTLRGIVAFLAVAGWGGLWLLRMGLNPVLAVFLAVAMGFWAMLLMALFLRVAFKLQSDGTMDYRNALGTAGTVYLTIPAGRAGTGKVNLLIQDQLMELDAVTDETEALPTGTEIVVVALSGGSTLVVCKK